MKVRNPVAGLALLLALTACSHVHVDHEPDGSEMRFDGISDYLRDNSEVHVLQTHGMGDHPHAKFCAPESENRVLEDGIVERLDYRLVAGSDSGVIPIEVQGIPMGSYSSRTYVDNPDRPTRTLYFSCLSWGEANQKIKKDLLELDAEFLEKNSHEARRAYLNREAKRFVNRSFSDPLIYSGPFGEYIRAAVWAGIDQTEQAQQASRRRRMSLLGQAPEASFLTSVPTVVISDSLGSRVMFDVLWSFDPPSGTDAALTALHSPELATEQGREKIRGRIRGLFMLANQLPLLALARIEPPEPGRTLDESIEAQRCLIPREPAAVAPPDVKTIVAMTDVNDALSYHLSDNFKGRCAPPGSGLRIVNVTLTNATPWFGLFANPMKAHASGFKENPRAVEYMVDGN